MLVGIAAYPLLPVAPLPRVDFPTIAVTGTLPGASPETMASTVAQPLERQFAQIAGVSQLTSVSVQGNTQVTVQFDLDRNIDAAAGDIQAAINAAGGQLPKNLPNPPTYRKVNPADSPILILAVQSDTLPLIEVDDWADNILSQQISQITGVSARCRSAGEQKRAVRVQVDPARLAAMGMTLEDVRNTLTNVTVNTAKGSIDGPRQAFAVYDNDQLTSASRVQQRDPGLPQRRPRAGEGHRHGRGRAGEREAGRLAERPPRHTAADLQAARRQRHRHGQQDPGRAAAPAGRDPALRPRRDGDRPHAHHPGLGDRTCSSPCCCPSPWW